MLPCHCVFFYQNTDVLEEAGFNFTAEPVVFAPADDSLTGGEIAGIVIAALVAAAILLAIIVVVLVYL